MDLNSFLQKYPQLKLLSSQIDNEKVLKLMSLSPMNLGGMDLLYDRSPEFQALLQAQGNRYLTLLSTSEMGDVTGCFSLSTSVKYINGEKKTCAYIGDFRTNGDRKVTLLWRNEYQNILNIFKNNEMLLKPKYFLTAVLKKNKEAIRNLAGNKKNFGFYYHLVCEKNMINVIGKWPFSSPSMYEVEKLQKKDFEQLKKFLDQQEKAKQFGSIFDNTQDDVWQFRNENWQNLDQNNFLVIKDQHKKIIASCLFWNPNKLKRMSVSRMNGFLEIGIKLINKIGINFPSSGQSLETVYMTHLNIDKSINAAEIVASFLNEALDIFPKSHMISFSDDFKVLSELGDYIKQSTSVLLYEVSTNKEPSFNIHDKFSFEMSLV